MTQASLDGSLSLGLDARGGPIKLRLQPVRPGWGIVYLDGLALTQPTPWPWLDACLVLFHRGKWGPVELWDYVRPYPLREGSVQEVWRAKYRPSPPAIPDTDGRRHPRHYNDGDIKPGRYNLSKAERNERRRVKQRERRKLAAAPV